MQKNIFGYIYKIRNLKNNRIYIGQTTKTFDIRYKGNLYKHTHNIQLKADIEIYGIENFEVDKEFDVAYSRKELNNLEKLYIKTYNTLNKKYGYNKILSYEDIYTFNNNGLDSKFRKCVINIKTGRIYNSIREASEKCNINSSEISGCINGHEYNNGEWELLENIKPALDEYFKFNINFDDYFSGWL